MGAAKTDLRREQVMRWLKFNAVGLAGFAVQIGALRFFSLTLGWHYLLATALAVEAAIVHNFFWHQRFTWKDNARAGWRSSMRRFLEFNLSCGALSLADNLLLMRWLVGALGLPPFLASLISVSDCSVATFMVGHLLIFQGERPTPAGTQPVTGV